MEKIYSDERADLYWGDIFECLEYLPKDTIQAAITSPTYWGKRAFTIDKREFGSEKLEEYVNKNVRLYSSLLDLMKDGCSLFFVMQDSYMGSGVSRSHHNHWEHNIDPSWRRIGTDSQGQGNVSSVTAHHKIIKNKSLSGTPYRIALKLVDMGYIWREQIIWEKPNPMPENIKDRVRQSAEYIFHFTKCGKYKFNPKPMMVRGKSSGRLRLDNQVWIIPSEPKKSHTATFPSKLVERLMLAVTDEGDIVLDPFLGSGTMLDVSLKNQRKFIGCDINKDFIIRAAKRAKEYESTQISISKFL
jgi:hypothetical protein